MWKHKGFFISDVLFTMSALIVICSLILPLVIHIIHESINEKKKFEATIVLYETLHDWLVENQTPITSEVVSSSGKLFELISVPELKEVCVRYEDTRQVKKRVCEYWE